MARSVSACLSWRGATFFFGKHRASALKSSHHKIFESHATGCAEIQSYRYLGGHRWANKSMGLRTKHRDTEVDHHSTLCRCEWIATAPGPVEVRPLQEFYEIIPVAIFSVHGFFHVMSKQTRKESQCLWELQGEKKQICGSLHCHAPVISRPVTCTANVCKSTQENRCQGGKSSRLCRRTGSFPIVTVTNLSANRSTLNSCNFVVSWWIELNCCVGKLKSFFFLQHKFCCKRLRFEQSSAVASLQLGIFWWCDLKAWYCLFFSNSWNSMHNLIDSHWNVDLLQVEVEASSFVASYQNCVLINRTVVEGLNREIKVWSLFLLLFPVISAVRVHWFPSHCLCIFCGVMSTISEVVICAET